MMMMTMMRTKILTKKKNLKNKQKKIKMKKKKPHLMGNIKGTMIISIKSFVILKRN